jgi:putative membrane protein
MSTDVEVWLEKGTLASNVSRGLISGVLGGLAGTLIKVAIEKVLPVRKPNTKSAQLKMVDELSIKVSGEPISSSNKEIAEQLVNFPFGASVGATYGYGKRDEMETSLFDGAMLGATTWVGTHETSFPMLGLTDDPEDIPMKLQANELLAHVAFGLTTELVRAFVARRLKD